MYVKICGIRTPTDARSAIDAGADAIGIILSSDSPRSVSRRRAEAIIEAASGRVETVCVTTSRSPADLRMICSLSPDAVQIYHPLSLPDRFITITDWDGISDPPEGSDRLLLDPSRGRGIPMDIDHAEAAIRRTDLPVILAGGLTPASVPGVIHSLHPAGLDVSSGVEQRPGLKDPILMEAFLRACRGGV
ncbi:hypothetical protein RJ53_10275 [Methanocalculus chunghsingensis]|uniref:N-(5'-phosphoribosyl)anthranilate isomerase n=1 Tax=Methanocalculus chunghsingensis TaxID=156457 RepID=A0A8J7W7I0_9EURY|nr:phosphoribosylanthranilate isomerase [Methanocalculus chunghsingensis]MBR1369841.1 hypothetical protein [Methanocalculus chunghsingensis]